jgi:hypothetical protein
MTEDNPEQACKAIARDRNVRIARAREAILAHLVYTPEAYSKEFRRLIDVIPLAFDIHAIGSICRELEAEGKLDSRFVPPPHDDVPGNGGMGRRYYRLRKA